MPDFDEVLGSGMERLRVVITGGPCAGKTELWRSLGGHFPRAELVAEVATGLILSGETPDRLGLERFQRRVFELQSAREGEALRRGSLIICDRGLADGLAYLPTLPQILGIPPADLLGRYDLVLHPAVIESREVYLRHALTNPARRESHEQAVELDRRLATVYGRHPGYRPLAGALEEKKSEALRLLRARLAGPCA